MLKRAGKLIGIGAGAFVGIVGIALVVLYLTERSKVTATYDIEPAEFEIPEGEEAVAEGERLYHARMCVECHGDDAGGSVLADMWAMTLVPANLTVVAQAFSSSDFARAVRHGVSPSGRPYIHMPVDDRMWHLSDRDLGYIIAYLRTLPHVDHDLPATELKFWGMIFDAVGMVPVAMVPSSVIDHDAPRPEPPEIAETAEFGRYVLTVTGCQLCHHENLSGGPVPMMPEEDGIPRNITTHETGIAEYTLEDFTRVLREGVMRDGSAVNPNSMSPAAYGRLTDTEITALWAYIQSVEPAPYGEH